MSRIDGSGRAIKGRSRLFMWNGTCGCGGSALRTPFLRQLRLGPVLEADIGSDIGVADSDLKPGFHDTRDLDLILIKVTFDVGATDSVLKPSSVTRPA